MQEACQPLPRRRPLAPLWHTRVLLGVLLLAPATALVQSQPLDVMGPQLTKLYLPLLLANTAFFAYVTRVGLGESKFAELFGRRFDRVQGPLEALGGLLLAGLVLGLDEVLQRVTGSAESLASHALLPRGTSAELWWLAVALSTGFSEELLYRGYLRRQLAVMTGSEGAGNLLQALLFGVAHGLQGPEATLRSTLYGLLFGLVAKRRDGLLAVVVCHSVLDAYAGLSG